MFYHVNVAKDVLDIRILQESSILNMQLYSGNSEKKQLKRIMPLSVLMAGNKTQKIYWEMINVSKLPQYLQLKQIYFKKSTSPKQNTFECFSMKIALCVCVCVCARTRTHTQSCLTLRPHGLQPTRLLCPRDLDSIKTASKHIAKISLLKEFKYVHICLKINILFSSSTQQPAGKKCQ